MASAWLMLAWVGLTGASPALALPLVFGLVLAVGRWG
jgi:hypothetical protein